MSRALRWIRNMLLGLLGLLGIAVATVYALSERTLRRTYEEPLVSIPIPADSESIAEGGRLAQLRGCRGCHEPDLSGGMFVDEAMLARIAAPNLTEAVRNYSDPELVRTIRRGVRLNGRSIWIMPSEMFAPLTDADLGKIIAFVRSMPPAPGVAPRFAVGPVGRFGIATRKFEPTTAWVRRGDSVTASGYFPAPGEPNAFGAYLAQTSCTECHDLTLDGGETNPDLRIAAGYTLEQFAHFFKTGEALGGRELELMSKVARNRFSHFTDAEVSALYAYLVARAATLADSTTSP